MTTPISVLFQFKITVIGHKGVILRLYVFLVQRSKQIFAPVEHVELLLEAAPQIERNLCRVCLTCRKKS